MISFIQKLKRNLFFCNGPETKEQSAEFSHFHHDFSSNFSWVARFWSSSKIMFISDGLNNLEHFNEIFNRTITKLFMIFKSNPSLFKGREARCYGRPTSFFVFIEGFVREELFTFQTHSKLIWCFLPSLLIVVHVSFKWCMLYLYIPSWSFSSNHLFSSFTVFF